MKIKVCYILSYKAPDYVRTTSIVNSLSLLNNLELFQPRNKSKGLFRYLETFVKFLKIRIEENPDIYIIGFRGHEIYWLYRIFAFNKIFIFDEMMSPYDSLINEKKIITRNGIMGKLIYRLEKGILNNSNYILTDTQLHSRFLTKTFGISAKKIKVVPVGTDENLFDVDTVREKDMGNDFIVFFYGSFLPLHGINVILEAAKLLEKYPIKFMIIGGKGNKRVLKEYQKKLQDLRLKNVEHQEWVDFISLPSYIKRANLCLGGPFGGTNQAKRVVTGKTYQFLHMGKATIIGKIKEQLGFIDKENCLLVEQNSPKDLADSILWGYNNPELLMEIGKNSKKFYNKNFSYYIISNKFKFLEK